MKKILYIFLVLAVILVVLSLNYITNSGKLPLGLKLGEGTPTNSPVSTKVNLTNCMSIDVKNSRLRIKIVDLMRKYLAENENTPLTTTFEGKVIEGTNCYSLKISDLELYEDKDGDLVILKNGEDYKKVSSRYWNP